LCFTQEEPIEEILQWCQKWGPSSTSRKKKKNIPTSNQSNQIEKKKSPNHPVAGVERPTIRQIVAYFLTATDVTYLWAVTLEITQIMPLMMAMTIPC
jgi:hypothetical protein